MIATPNLAGFKPVQIDARVLDTHRDSDHGRTVVTLGGPVDEVVASSLVLAEWVLEHLDLGHSTGVHPRVGALDVLPLVPYLCDESFTQNAALELGQALERLGLPVETYGRAHPEERSLPELRRELRSKAHRSHPTAGVVCLGIRDPLIAFNVNFRGDVQAARHVARLVRAPEVRALGFNLASRGLVQVSMNLVQPDQVGPKLAFERVLSLTRDTELELVDCEVVGLVPEPNLAELEDLPLRAPVRSIEQALRDR